MHYFQSPLPFLSLLIILLSAAAHRLRLLTAWGAIAAAAVALSSLVLGGVPATVLLFLFFATSNLLGMWRKQKKRKLGFEKGGTRDQWQVLANGGPALVGLIAGHFFLQPHFGNQIPIILYAAGLAEAAADTWATEIGSATKGETRSIITGKPTPTGQSGGISWIGTAAAAFGSFVIVIALDWLLHGHITVRAAVTITTSGFCGAVTDSLLGATIQAQYKNAAGRVVEKTSGAFRQVRGLKWFRNDAVNFVAGLLSVLYTIAALWLN